MGDQEKIVFENIRKQIEKTHNTPNMTEDETIIETCQSMTTHLYNIT